MTALIHILSIIGPVFITAFLGYIAYRLKPFDIGSISRLVLYIFTPCLVFSSLQKVTIEIGEANRLIAAVLIMTVILWVMGAVVGRLLKLDQGRRSGLTLGLVLMNTGNYGLPVCEFAFGPDGLAIGVVIFICNCILSSTLGVYIAGRGRGKSFESIKSVFKIPVIYAAVLSIVMLHYGLKLPFFLDRSVDLMRTTAIPLMLIILGGQLARTEMMSGNLQPLVCTFIRLIVSPLIALGIGLLLGMTGIMLKVFILVMGMPPAVFTTVLASQFGSALNEVSKAVFIATLFSFATLSIILYFIT
jgi:malate permease and related proteins